MPVEQTLTFGIAWFVVFVFSTTLHEAAHAFVALRLGDPTAYEGGQVTLNPLPHIRREPFGMVFVPLISFFLSGWMIGWASAPYNPVWAHAYPRRAAWMAIAGPASNLILVLLAAAAIRGGVMAGVFHPPSSVTFSHVVTAAVEGPAAAAAMILSVFFSLNLLLFAFNLLPVPPLDGSGAMPLLLSDDAARRYRLVMSQPTLSLIGLVIAWRIFGVIFGPVHRTALNLLYYPLASYY